MTGMGAQNDNGVKLLLQDALPPPFCHSEKRFSFLCHSEERFSPLCHSEKRFSPLCHSEKRFSPVILRSGATKNLRVDAYKAEEKILRFAQSEIHFALSLA